MYVIMFLLLQYFIFIKNIITITLLYKYKYYIIFSYGTALGVVRKLHELRRLGNKKKR